MQQAKAAASRALAQAKATLAQVQAELETFLIGFLKKYPSSAPLARRPYVSKHAAAGAGACKRARMAACASCPQAGISALHMQCTAVPKRTGLCSAIARPGEPASRTPPARALLPPHRQRVPK